MVDKSHDEQHDMPSPDDQSIPKSHDSAESQKLIENTGESGAGKENVVTVFHFLTKGSQIGACIGVIIGIAKSGGLRSLESFWTQPDKHFGYLVFLVSYAAVFGVLGAAIAAITFYSSPRKTPNDLARAPNRRDR